MIDHIRIAVSDLERSRRFYCGVLTAIGYTLLTEGGTSLGFGPRLRAKQLLSLDPGGGFWIYQGRPSSSLPHFAFAASSRSEVQAFFHLGLLHGGAGNGGPALRTQYHAHYYACFLLDPDGYNIEAVCHSPG